MADTVVTDIESKNKVSRHLNFGNLFFVIGYLMVAYMVRGLVSPLLQIPYFVFSGVCAVLLSIPSATNRGRNNLEALLLMRKADKTTYRPMPEEGDNNNDD